MGDIAYQSIAGAIADRDPRHGYGALRQHRDPRRSASRSSPVTARSCAPTTKHTDTELLRVARVGVGALGIVTEVTELRPVVPAFNLHAVETIELLVDVIADFRTVMHSTDHVEFFWMPGGRRCQVKRNTVTDAPARAAVEVRLHQGQVDRREPRLRDGVSSRSPLPKAGAEGRQPRDELGIRS